MKILISLCLPLVSVVRGAFVEKWFKLPDWKVPLKTRMKQPNSKSPEGLRIDDNKERDRTL